MTEPQYQVLTMHHLAAADQINNFARVRAGSRHHWQPYKMTYNHPLLPVSSGRKYQIERVSAQQIVNHFTVNIGEPKIAAGVAVGKFLMVKP
jgi:hypothetical protein